MSLCGVEHIPTFEHPRGELVEEQFSLGHACEGQQIPHCLGFYQSFFADFTETTLAEQVCVPKCRR